MTPPPEQNEGRHMVISTSKLSDAFVEVADTLVNDFDVIVFLNTLTEHAAHFFREAHRVLRPGGVLRITCPNIDLYQRAYRAKDMTSGRILNC